MHYAPDGRDLMARTLNIGDDDAAARSAAGDRLAAAAADAMARFAAARHLEPIRPWSELTETERDVIRAAVVALIGRRHRADLATLI